MATILIVDDETDFRQEMTTLLQEWGYKAISAASGTLALELAQAEKPEIALVDLILPGAMNGYNVISKIHNNSPETIIFAITAYYNTNLESRVSNAGANRFYKKPLDINKFKSDLANIVGIPETLSIPAPSIEAEKNKLLINPKKHKQKELVKLFKFLKREDYKKLIQMGRTISLTELNEHVSSIPQNIVLIHQGIVTITIDNKFTKVHTAGETFGKAFILGRDIPTLTMKIKAEGDAEITVIETIHLRNFFKLHARYTSVFLLELSRSLSQENIAEYKLGYIVKV